MILLKFIWNQAESFDAQYIYNHCNMVWSRDIFVNISSSSSALRISTIVFSWNAELFTYLQQRYFLPNI